jgi:hypothetical protein
MSEQHGPWKLIGLHLDADGVPVSALVQGTASGRRFRVNATGPSSGTIEIPIRDAIDHKDRPVLDRIGPPWRLVAIHEDITGWPNGVAVAAGKGERLVIEGRGEYEIPMLPRSRRWGASEPVSDTVQAIEASPALKASDPKVAAAPAIQGPRPVAVPPREISPATRTLLTGLGKLFGPKRAS